MLARKDVQRQIAVNSVIPVVAVEESAFLIAVNQIIRRVLVQHNLIWCGGVRLDESYPSIDLGLQVRIRFLVMDSCKKQFAFRIAYGVASISRMDINTYHG
jgi:hypothetical protein